jgi:hypothetical protein
VCGCLSKRGNRVREKDWIGKLDVRLPPNNSYVKGKRKYLSSWLVPFTFFFFETGSCHLILLSGLTRTPTISNNLDRFGILSSQIS